MTPPAADRCFEIEPLERSGYGTDDVLAFLLSIDDDFDPPMRTRVDLPSYVRKIAEHACVHIAHEGCGIAGLAAVYANDLEGRVAYITCIGVAREARGYGLARRLMEACLQTAAEAGMRTMRLETSDSNGAAQKLYSSLGFAPEGTKDNRGPGVRSIVMVKSLPEEPAEPGEPVGAGAG